MPSLIFLIFPLSRPLLDREIDNFVQLVILCRHAGFSYSGPTAGWAYKYFQYAPKEYDLSKLLYNFALKM
jgi:predicted class III extradiol MEMO1 family dioxygenase